MTCPKCHEPIVRGPLFVACSTWPRCPWSEPLVAESAAVLPGFESPTPALPDRQQLALFERWEQP